MTVTARRATSLGESESSLVEDDDDDDDDEFVIVRTHAHTQTHTQQHTTRRTLFTGRGKGACLPTKLDDKSAAGCWTVDRRRRTFTEAAGKKLEILEKVRNERREGKESGAEEDERKWKISPWWTNVRRCDGTERVGWLVSRLDVRWVRVGSAGSVGAVCRAGLPPVSSMKI